MMQIQKQDGIEIKTAEADTTPKLPTAEPRVAMALGPNAQIADPAAPTLDPAAPPAPVATTPAAAPAPSPASLYADGVRRIEAKDASGLESLRKAANLSYAPAQFYLAKLYENGEGGVKKDAGEARRWTERAAQGGDRKAMHNLGLYYFEGTGGSLNKTTAAQWFRKAADLGLTDSQYNLGKLYENGFGVNQNAPEAYKWYLIASRAGDSEARGSAERIRSSLSAEERSGAERSAAGYRAALPNPSAQTRTAQAPAAGVSIAQKSLSRLGYYQGPQDGVASPALSGAISAYQRDQALPVTGQLDGVTQARLAIYAR
jgi:localization factor PodJL